MPEIILKSSEAFEKHTLVGQVVQKAIKANSGLNVDRGLCFSCFKAFPVLIL